MKSSDLNCLKQSLERIIYPNKISVIKEKNNGIHIKDVLIFTIHQAQISDKIKNDRGDVKISIYIPFDLCKEVKVKLNVNKRNHSYFIPYYFKQSDLRGISEYVANINEILPFCFWSSPHFKDNNWDNCNKNIQYNNSMIKKIELILVILKTFYKQSIDRDTIIKLLEKMITGNQK